MIQVNHLSKSYISPDGKEVQVLKDITCHIEKGEVISIIGPSGTGKSTFLRALNLLDPPTGGEIIIDNQNILEKNYPLNKLRQHMGMVFQNFNLFEHLTILENLTIGPIKLLGLSKEEAEKEAMQMLRKVGMSEKAVLDCIILEQHKRFGQPLENMDKLHEFLRESEADMIEESEAAKHIG